MNTDDIRKILVDKYKRGEFRTIGNAIQQSKTVEIQNANFEVDKYWIVREPNFDYAQRELEWYMTKSLNVNDIPGGTPKMWLATADANGAFGYYGSTQIDGVNITKIDNQTYKFEVPAFVLNGTSEKVNGGVDSKELKYQLVFDKYARNDFQASNVKVDYLVEVKQHTYDNPAEGWSEVASVSLTLGQSASGDVKVQAVPGDGQ